jgi:hypothetical protein
MDPRKSQISEAVVMNLPKVSNRAGNITALNSSKDVPFSISRVYFLYDIPAGEGRGGHAHKGLEQLIIATSGSFTVKLNDGSHYREITLNRPDIGLYLIPGIWRELTEFSSGAICLVLASQGYDEKDYIRDYQEFKSFKLL